MCGIVGLLAKSTALEQELGGHLAAMLRQMSDRGPDSAGVALYREPAPLGFSKLTLFSSDPLENWQQLRKALADAFAGSSGPSMRASHAVFSVGAEASEAEEWIRDRRPDLRVMSA